MADKEFTHPRVRARYSVSFEFDTRPPLTHRGIVEGWAASTCTRRAVEEAQNILRPINWTSMVCVLLERLDAPDELETPVIVEEADSCHKDE